jgi:hypothetical protein
VKILPHIQGSDEWLAARAGLATASCFADIMATLKSGGEAVERRNYRARLVVERLTGKPVSTYQNKSMQQGQEREPFARRAYEVKTANLVEEVGLCLHDELECGASPDGLIDDDGGLEIKCPELSAHLRYLKLEKGCPPPEYFWQVQGALWITGREYWDFASWNPDFPENLQLVIRRVARDKQAIDKLAGEVARFMDEVRGEVEAVSKLAA